MRILEKLITLIEPDCCYFCNTEGFLLCNACEEQHLIQRKPACFWCNALSKEGKTCGRCRGKTYLSGATIPFRYQEGLKQLIYDLKYNGNRRVAPRLAGTLAAHVPFQPTVVTYVPATGASLRKRGYNQSELIAKTLAKSLRLPCTKLLCRHAHLDQIGQGRAGRIANVSGVFSAMPQRCKDQQVLLVDDVVTTGATVNECAKTLRQAGSTKVWAVAMAKK